MSGRPQRRPENSANSHLVDVNAVEMSRTRSGKNGREMLAPRACLKELSYFPQGSEKNGPLARQDTNNNNNNNRTRDQTMQGARVGESDTLVLQVRTPEY